MFLHFQIEQKQAHLLLSISHYNNRAEFDLVFIIHMTKLKSQGEQLE